MGPQFYHYNADFIALAKKKLNTDISGIANVHSLKFLDIKLSNIVQKLDRNFKEEKAGVFYEPDLTGRSKPHISFQIPPSEDNQEGSTYLSLEKAPRNRAIENLLMWPDFKAGSSDIRHIHDLVNSVQVEELIELKGKASFSVLNPDYNKVEIEKLELLNKRKWFEPLSTARPIGFAGAGVNRLINLLLALECIGLLFLNPILGLLVLLFLLFRILLQRRKVNSVIDTGTVAAPIPQGIGSSDNKSNFDNSSAQENEISTAPISAQSQQKRGCFQGLYRILKWVFRIAIFLSVIGFIISVFSSREASAVDPIDTDNLKLENIKKDGSQKVIQKHSISWNVIDRDFAITYYTNGSDFNNAMEDHNEIVGFNSGDSRSYFRKVYQHLMSRDNRRIDSVVNMVRQAISDSGLNQLESAEYVIGLIQEIPYVLVHDNTCEGVVMQNGAFVQWHIEGKPCLASVPAGVQSPYEFLHNMKGDCDTRSLLAHAILSKLGIHSSIWISENYGHSILGVAVPGVNSRAFKRLDGLNHYGVELTAKGFRVGMISPDQMDLRNWDVALFN